MHPDLARSLALLADRGATRDERIKALRELVSHPDRAAVLPLLRQLLADPACADLLPVVVRSFGYASSEAVADLKPYLAHADPEVVENAVKALHALDPALAVRLATAQLKRAKSRIGAAIARVLVERCPAEALPAVRELALAERARHRTVALVFLKKLPAPQALPLLLDMFRRESNPRVRKLLLAVIARRARPDHVAELTRVHADLLSKAKELAALIIPGTLGTPQTPGTLGTHGTPGMPLPEPSSEFDRDVLPASVELAIPPQLRAELAAPPPPAPLKLSAPVPRPPAPPLSPAPSPSLPPPPPTPDLPPASPIRHLLAAAAVLGLLSIFIVSQGQFTASTSTAHSSPAPLHPLGNVGSPVRFSAPVTSVDAQQNMLVMQLENGSVAEVQLQSGETSRFQPGDALKVMGVIRQIRPGPRLRILAFQVGK